MGRHSVVEAKNQLSELIDRVLKGESVVITRHGHPVVELKAIASAVKAITPEGLDWVARRRVGKRKPRQDAATLVGKMRDAWKS